LFGFGVAKVGSGIAILSMLDALGIYGLLYRKSDPDYVPEWYKRHVLLYLSLFAFVLAAVFFVFSLL